MRLLLTYLFVLLTLLGCLPSMAAPLDGICKTQGADIHIHGLFPNDPALEFAEKVIRVQDGLIEVTRIVGQRWDSSVYFAKIENDLITFEDPGFDWNENGRVSYRDMGESIILYNKGNYEIYYRIAEIPKLKTGDFAPATNFPGVMLDWRVGKVRGRYILTPQETLRLFTFTRTSIPYQSCSPTGSYQYSFRSGGQLNRVKYKFTLRTFLVGEDPSVIGNYEIALSIHRMKYGSSGSGEEILLESYTKPFVVTPGGSGDVITDDKGEIIDFTATLQ